MVITVIWGTDSHPNLSDDNQTIRLLDPIPDGQAFPSDRTDSHRKAAQVLAANQKIDSNSEALLDQIQIVLLTKGLMPITANHLIPAESIIATTEIPTKHYKKAPIYWGLLNL